MENSNRLYDIALFGSSGFTGTLIAEYLAGHAGDVIPGIRIALVGRDATKLETVKKVVENINSNVNWAAVVCDLGNQV